MLYTCYILLYAFRNYTGLQTKKSEYLLFSLFLIQLIFNVEKIFCSNTLPLTMAEILPLISKYLPHFRIQILALFIDRNSVIE